jgi:hypothetical protein
MRREHYRHVAGGLIFGRPSPSCIRRKVWGPRISPRASAYATSRAELEEGRGASVEFVAALLSVTIRLYLGGKIAAR